MLTVKADNGYYIEKELDIVRYKNPEGKLHRLSGPALEYNNGTKYWYFHGLLHRIDGAAIEYWNGNKVWYYNGRLHRIEGPAIEYIDAPEQNEYWVYGQRVAKP